MISLAKNISREKQRHLTKLFEMKSTLPWYVEEYLDVKRRARMAPSTLVGYAHNYVHFFQWLIDQQNEKMEIKNIPLSLLENLRKSDVEMFLDYLQVDRGLSDSAINRYIASLRSLFSYLTTETEDEDGECYFYRNVMGKIKAIRIKEDDASKADTVANQIFQGNTDKEFLRFLVEDYPEMLTKRAKTEYLKHQLRDVAIISLFLGSGIRVSELVQLTIDDINFPNRTLSVLRKGNKKSVILATRSSLDDVQEYLKIRKERYNVPDNENHLFVTFYNKQCRPLSVRRVQTIVSKYTQAFLMKMSPHKLRHTFATKHWLANNDQIALMRQLGHNSIQTTTIYTNINMEDRLEQMDRLDEYSDNVNE